MVGGGKPVGMVVSLRTRLRVSSRSSPGSGYQISLVSSMLSVSEKMKLHYMALWLMVTLYNLLFLCSCIYTIISPL